VADDAGRRVIDGRICHDHRPDEASLRRLVSAVLGEISDHWETE
jgi:hypothetical protein